MLKAILIDDEPNNLKTLQHDLQECCPQVEIVAVCSSGKEGLINIHQHRPDLVFLDIDMPAMTGFEMLQCLEKIYFDVIFTTAHQQYAIDAFRIHQVVDYLLKPIKKAHLIEAVARVDQRNQHGISEQNLEMIQADYNAQAQIIPLRASDGIDFIQINDIVYAKSEGNYITIYTLKGKTKNSPYCSFTLSYLEQELPSAIFCRIHQSHLININHTVNYNRAEKFVLMSNKVQLAVSNGGRGKLLSQLRFK